MKEMPGERGRFSVVRKLARKAAITSPLLLLFIICMWALSSSGLFAFLLPDTGQTICYSGATSTPAPCVGTGQDAAYSSSSMDYIDHGNGTVTDNVTGLMWQKNDDGTQKSLAQAVAYCGSLNLGGATGWRLPSKQEQLSLVDYSLSFPGPMLNTTYFPGGHPSFASSDLSVTNPGVMWGVNYSDGHVNGFGVNGGSYVRCVNGPQSQPSFVNNNNGTVSDNTTGLAWQQATGPSTDWNSALSYCESLNLGGSSDWRLPNIKELESIVDDTTSSPAVNAAFFPNTVANFYWSSTSSGNSALYAFHGNFDGGFLDESLKTSNQYVRCVSNMGTSLPRTGQMSCYDASGVWIPCPGTRQDGEIQAGVPWPTPNRFSAGTQTVLDTLTGLEWTKDAGTPTFAACSGGPKDWQSALNYVACLNSNHYLNHNDWRLPNINELKSTINVGQTNTSLWLLQGFIGPPLQTSNYWSSTTAANNTGFAWGVRFDDVIVDYDSKNNSYYVWPVRGGLAGAANPAYPANVLRTGQTISYDANSPKRDDGALRMGVAWPAQRFSINVNQTISDNLTGLTWAPDAGVPNPAVGQCTGGLMHWAGSGAVPLPIDYVDCLNANQYLGRSDWRVPNINELYSLGDRSRANDTLPLGHPFQGVQATHYWSSTAHTGVAGDAWSVDMNGGGVYYGDRNPGSYVWPVAGGALFPPVNAPMSFVIAPQTGIAPGATAISNSITVSGLNAPVSIFVSGGQYSINGGAFTSEPGTVVNGSTVRVSLTSVADVGQVSSATLTIGDVSRTFSVTTGTNSGGGTRVPVMEGWWLMPGLLAGVGIFARRRKE
ncbi:MAG: hypothetical protein A2075_22625 [Geobacteraceae bacterium GWC2_58_44]|nr:MAG: hypothetical protein A2075_22625 [Geobacteraceae bacterium GWC2_58_44]